MGNINEMVNKYINIGVVPQHRKSILLSITVIEYESDDYKLLRNKVHHQCNNLSTEKNWMTE